MQGSAGQGAAGQVSVLEAGTSIAVTGSIRHGRALIGLLNAQTYPIAGTLVVSGLMPGPHYHVRGNVDGFCRADEAGEALLSFLLTEPTHVVIEPVI